jgi:hypothetical protein
MITGLLPTARARVDLGGGEALGCDGIEKEMIDAQACIALKGSPPIFPEGVDLLVVMEMGARRRSNPDR